ncbi:MAG: hypothetical protein WAM05_11025, partial [Candidatus Binataceae bacterium]
LPLVEMTNAGDAHEYRGFSQAHIRHSEPGEESRGVHAGELTPPAVALRPGFLVHGSHARENGKIGATGY